jgi:hypothetical protein
MSKASTRFLASEYVSHRKAARQLRQDNPVLLVVAKYYTPRFSNEIVTVRILETAQDEDLFVSKLRARTWQHMEELIEACFLTTDTCELCYLLYISHS